MDFFSSSLLNWFAANGRDLPWRGCGDAYRIWLSEVILQQTRIAQGLDYWYRFLQELPTVEALAAADEDKVLRLWQGLGYYSRARNLHAAAKQVVALGGFPDTAEGLRQLKGVGDYTAAAVASFAFGRDVAAVDGNVFRVLARHFGIETPINSSGARKEFTALAQALLPKGRSADFNQALMDFGALCCTPASPRCEECPVSETCVALRTGRVSALPVKLKKTKVKERHFIYVYVRCGDEVALHRRPAGDIWQGLYEPWLLEDASVPAVDGRLTLLRQQVKHVLTHRILLADFYLLETTMRPELPNGYFWVAESQRDQYAVPRLVELLYEALEC